MVIDKFLSLQGHGELASFCRGEDCTLALPDAFVAMTMWALE